jgi:hypothetical protein
MVDRSYLALKEGNYAWAAGLRDDRTLAMQKALNANGTDLSGDR